MANVADMRRQLDEQTRILRESVRALPETYREVQAEAVTDAYRDLVESSPRRTGAYQNEHIIEEGDGGATLFESPNRVGHDAIVNPPTLLDVPALEGRIQSAGDFATVQIANRRFYAAALEYGTAASAPRHIYEGAAVRARVNTERIAERASKRESK